MSIMTVLYYIHDPMCSWCWGFQKTWETVKTQLPKPIDIQYLVGGLAPDSDQAMPIELQAKLPQIWKTIQAKIPGTEFNFDFWTNCKPRRSTYPACRAVLAAKSLDTSKEDAMILGIQHAYYLNAKNPSDLNTLQDVAESIGLDKLAFTEAIKSPTVEDQLKGDINKARYIGGTGFPSLVMQLGENANARYQFIPIDYNNPDIITESIIALV